MKVRHIQFSAYFKMNFHIMQSVKWNLKVCTHRIHNSNNISKILRNSFAVFQYFNTSVEISINTFMNI